jgi:putative ABC transport system permease protein
MNLLRALRLHFRALFQKEELDARMDDEMRAHLEMQTQENIEAGMKPEEARYAALRQFGWVESIKATCRDQRGLPWLETLWHDLHYGARQLRRNPTFTVVAVLTLALGIGGSTAIFSLINGVILRPLPFPEPDGLFSILTQVGEAPPTQTSYRSYLDWRERSTAFQELAIFDSSSCLLTGADDPERVVAALTSAGFFSVLRAAPALGGTFTKAQEHHRAAVVVVSHGLWQRRFAGESNIVGRTIEIDGQTTEIIGVMPEHFTFAAGEAGLWKLQAPEPDGRRGTGRWWVLGRLKPGWSADQAQAELRGVAARIAEMLPSTRRNLSVQVMPLSHQIAGPNLRLALWILFAAVFAVLLIGCSNLANLLLVRGVARRRELATRVALGASARRVTRQLIVECLPVGLLGGMAGIAVAAFIIRVLRAVVGAKIPRLTEVELDPAVLCFALGLTGLATLCFAMIPGLQARSIDLNDALKAGARETGGLRQTFLRQALLVGEVALAFTLLFAAGLLVRSFQNVRTKDLGFNPKNLMIVNLRLPQSKTNESASVFYTELSGRLETLPDIEGVGLISDIFGGANVAATVTLDGGIVADLSEVRSDAITPRWFHAVGTPLLRGRAFDSGDHAGALRVAILNQTMARRLWPREDPVGKRFKFGPTESREPWLTVVGLAPDMRRQRLEREPMAQVFVPVAQAPERGMELLIRSAVSPGALAETIRREVRAIEKGAFVSGVSTLEQRIGNALFERRFQTSLLSAFSLVALMLAAVGTYGVVHYSVQQRVREIGVRMILGAQKGDVLGMIVTQGLKMVFIGVSAGILVVFAMMRLMERLLYEIKPTDPFTFAAVAFLLLGIAMFACWLPARGATRVDPIAALRYE